LLDELLHRFAPDPHPNSKQVSTYMSVL